MFKKIFLILITFLIGISSFSQSKSANDVYVEGYYRSDGTYVKPHYRSAPNGTNRDNFSTKGNVNPYTGEKGYIEPDRKPNKINKYSQRNSVSSSNYPTLLTIKKKLQSSHKIFGIDLNLDWYTLTELSVLSYQLGKIESDKQKIPGVSVRLDDTYLNRNATEEFLNIGFKDIVITFPKLEKVGAEIAKEMSPVMFSANIKYTSDTKYAENARGDFNRVAYLAMNQFGAPDSTMKKEWGASFQWKFDNAELLLIMNKKQHINLLYLKSNWDGK